MEPQPNPRFSLPFADLLARARQKGGGDPLGELLQACWSSLHSFAARHVPVRIQNKVPPEDVVQEGMYLACRRFARFVGTTVAEWYSWVLRIVQRCCIGFLRLYRRRKRHLDRERSLDADPALQAQAVSSQPTSEEMAAGPEAQQVLDEAVGSLPLDQQDVIVLRQEGRTNRETAARLHTSPIKVRRTYRKALACLVQCLCERGFDAQ